MEIVRCENLSKVKEHIFPFYNFSVEYNETKEMPQDFPFYGENKNFEEIHEETEFANSYKIVGIINAPAYETNSCAFYSALTFTPNQFENGMHGNVTCKLNKDSYSQYDYVTQIEEIMGSNSESYEVNDLVLAFSSQTSDNSLNWMINMITIFFLVFILCVSMILIYNVFNISYEERSKYLGMLSSIGATKQQKCSSVYYETLFLLFLALPAGLLIGLATVKAGMMVLQPHIAKLEQFFSISETVLQTVHLVITPLNIMLVIGTSILTVFFSSLIPARKIAKVGPIESIRGTEKAKKKQFCTGKWLMKRSKPEALLAMHHLHRQTYKSKSIVRSVAIFIIVLLVTSYGTNTITKLVHYRLVDDVTIADNLKDYDFVLYEGNSAMYDALKEEIQKDSSVKEVKEWCMDMFSLNFDGNVLSDRYKDAYRAIASEYYHKELSEEEFAEIVEYEPGRWHQTMCIVSVDDATFQDIAQKSGCDKQVITEAECPGILYQSAQLSTKNISFSDSKPDHYQMFEIDHVCDKEVGEAFPAYYYQESQDKMKNVNITIAGYADSNDVKDYFSFHGEYVWMIVNKDNCEPLKPVLEGKRELHIDFSDNNSTLAQKLRNASNYTNDDYIISEVSKQKLQTIAETINYMIQVLAVAFVFFTAFICLLNLLISNV